MNDIKQMLGPLFDFSKHSATQNYVETLPEPIKKAIKEQHAIEGMNREQVVLAMGQTEDIRLAKPKMATKSRTGSTASLPER